MRTEQEYRNLEAENASLRERLEKAEKDADRYQFLRFADLDAIADDNWRDSEVWTGDKFDAAVDAAIKAQQAAEIERERTARKTAQESLENYKGECTRLQHEVDRLKGEGAVDRAKRT